MIEPKKMYECLRANDFCFYTGVPDSLLKELCSCFHDLASQREHIIAANEGNAVALACGYHIATDKYGVVYMQNSGLGNSINPLLSLADEKVYEIPMLLLIGYRGEPGVQDEPQHVKQGELTLPLLETLGIPYFMLDDGYELQIKKCYELIEETKKAVALVVRKDSFFKYERKELYQNPFTLSREEILEVLVKNIDDNDFIVSTTGKTSREIFEIREKYHMSHDNDFLTVGSMGHTSSLALGISMFSDKNIYCVDGDGAFLMHMGGLAVAMQNVKDNFKYILLNNGCHESVGKQPTIAYQIQIEKILESFGFDNVIKVETKEDMQAGITSLKEKGKIALVVYTNDKSRIDLGRPTTRPKDNKIAFEKKLRSQSYESNYF